MKYNGITYVEIVVSLLIFAMILPILINIFQFSNMKSRAAEDILQIPYIGQAYIEKIMAAPIDKLIENLSSEGVRYRGYIFDHTIRSYWNGNTDVTYHIITQSGEIYSIESSKDYRDKPYVIINAMGYSSDQMIELDNLNIDDSSDIFIYCTSENSDKFYIKDMPNITMILDSDSRGSIVFKLEVEMFESLNAKDPILYIETLFEKEIL